MKKLPFKGNMPNGESCDGMLYVKSPIDDDGKFKTLHGHRLSSLSMMVIDNG